MADRLTKQEAVELANVLKSCIEHEITQNNQQSALMFANCMKAVAEVMAIREAEES